MIQFPRHEKYFRGADYNLRGPTMIGKIFTFMIKN